MRSTIFVAAAIAILLLTSSGPAAVIDFETDPTGLPSVDDTLLSGPYVLAGGGTVRLFFDFNGNNSYDAGTDLDGVFEQIGNNGTNAFTNSTLGGISDAATPPSAPQLGNFFLRHQSPGIVPEPLIIDYNTSQTISALSGEIWDIDGASQATEQWLVEVLDGADNPVASVLSPLGNSFALDGLPWTFTFSGLPTGVDKLRITFQGSKTSGIGLAFNNFNPTAVPEPSSFVLAATVGTMLLGVAARRRRQSIVS